MTELNDEDYMEIIRPIVEDYKRATKSSGLSKKDIKSLMRELELIIQYDEGLIDAEEFYTDLLGIKK